MKKVIEQKKPIGDVRVWIDLKERIELRQSWGNGEHETVIIEKSKAREVALAICPEVEAELEKAKELLHEAGLQIDYLNQKYPATGTSAAVLLRINAFFEGK